MSIRNIAQVSCSVNLGYIYSVDYSFSPDGGSSITLFFVNQAGTYSRPQYMQKAFIRIGAATFSMYVVASDIQLADGRRIISVEFVDDTFLLDNYEVVLTGKGCGFNVFPLGLPVDRRTPAQKIASALDPTAQQIADFTTFQDVEYGFQDFLIVLRTKFSVQIQSSFDTTITNSFMGTFRDVLDSWCSLFNLAWFVENSVIKIFDPVTLSINLPAQPVDAIEYSSSEDIRSTYGKTVYNWFQQEGGEFPLNQAGNGDAETPDGGPLLVRTETLFPVGYEFNLPQSLTSQASLNQAAAAQFGQPFWFLYNYNLGTTSSQCGWTPVTDGTASIFQSVLNAGGRVASVNETAFNDNYQAYKSYGENIAGKWYLSNEKSTLAIDQGFQWFDESAGQIFNFTNVDDKSISIDYLTPTTAGTNIIPGTAINSFYSGVNYVGNRMAYQDTTLNATDFNLTPEQRRLVNNTYESINSINGSASMDFSSVAGSPNTFVGYQPIPIPQDLVALFDSVPSFTTGLKPRFTSIPVKGIRQSDYSTLKATQTEQSGVQIVNGNAGGNVVSNTAVIKTLRDGAYTVYYDKYSDCASAHSTGPYFQHRFEPRQISTDNAIQFTFSKQAGNVYRINRDFTQINSLVNNPFLSTLAQPRSFPTRKVSFTLNYFYSVPTNFLTNGLVGLSVSIGDNGVSATYTYSNEVLRVPYPEDQFAAFEQQIKNSAVRHYTPTTVIS